MRCSAKRSWIFTLILTLGAVTPASAAVIEVVATTFTGDPMAVRITFDDAGADAGEVWIGVEVEGGYQGDLRGLFLNLADDSLLAGLEVEGPYVTNVEKFDVSNVGRGANLHGGGSPCPCDLGIELGSPGTGRDDISSTYVVLSHDDYDLNVSMFREQLVGARVTSVGSGGRRNGSSKTIALVPVPEPSTAAFLFLGLAGLAFQGRRGRR
jgi:hypothetical protein